jgi:tetratricopeptide (TPR) repeat protein
LASADFALRWTFQSGSKAILAALGSIFAVLNGRRICLATAAFRLHSFPVDRDRRKQIQSKKNSPPPFDRRQMDRLHAAVSRALAGRDLNSPEEINQFLQEQLDAGAFEWDKLGTGQDATPLEQAQELFYKALDAPSRGMRVKMARQALAISEDCADAWILLAEDAANTRTEREDYLNKALAAAERVLGPEIFNEHGSYFWGVPETRPYMRAREALAALLAERGRMDEALAHWEAMLELNPNDNQGVRMLLLRQYLKKSDKQKTTELFERFPDDASCEMVYGRVLFELLGENEKAARKALRRALKINPHVPLFLFGLRPLPRRLPDVVTWGGEDEAGAYAAEFGDLWLKTPGALKLLKEVILSEKPPRRAKS